MYDGCRVPPQAPNISMAPENGGGGIQTMFMRGRPNRYRQWLEHSVKILRDTGNGHNERNPADKLNPSVDIIESGMIAIIYRLII